jgi:hypothetical protein
LHGNGEPNKPLGTLPGQVPVLHRALLAIHMPADCVQDVQHMRALLAMYVAALVGVLELLCQDAH